jgi:hypothetical protein
LFLQLTSSIVKRSTAQQPKTDAKEIVQNEDGITTSTATPAHFFSELNGETWRIVDFDLSSTKFIWSYIWGINRLRESGAEKTKVNSTEIEVNF